MIGQTISHYKILDQLSAQGMADVYLAEDAKLHRKVVLKFLPVECNRNPELRERFVREARAASAIDHPNICTIYEVGESETAQKFMVMAYYRGETLEKKLLYAPLQISEALNIAVQIARGLSAVHAANIVHRDLKPSNIIVTDNSGVKIIDFGLAKLSGHSKLTRSGTTLGTTAYMSPEQLRGEPIDHRSDIFCFGIVLYETLTGKHPFGGNDLAVAYAIVNKEPEVMSNIRTDLPDELDRVAARALKKVPNERYQSINDLLVELTYIDSGLNGNSTGATFSRIKRESLFKESSNKTFSAFLAFMLNHGPALAILLLLSQVLVLGGCPDVKMYGLWSVRLLIANWLETSVGIAQPAASHWAGGMTDFKLIVIHLLCALQLWFTKGLWQAESSGGSATHSIRSFLAWRKDSWTLVGLFAMLAVVFSIIYQLFLPDINCHVFGPTAKGLIANYRPDIPYTPDERFFLILHKFLQIGSLLLLLLTSAYVLPAYLGSSLSRPSLIMNADDKRLRVEILRTVSIPLLGIGILLILALSTAELGIGGITRRAQDSMFMAILILLLWLFMGLFRLMRVERKDLDFFVWLDRVVQRLRVVFQRLNRQLLATGIIMGFVLILPRLTHMAPVLIDFQMLELEEDVRNMVREFCAWDMKKERSLYSYVSRQVDMLTAENNGTRSGEPRQILESQVITRAMLIALFNHDLQFSRLVTGQPEGREWLKNSSLDEILFAIDPLVKEFDRLPVPFFYDANYLAGYRRRAAYQLLEDMKANRISFDRPGQSELKLSSEQVWDLAQLTYREHLSGLHFFAELNTAK